MPWKRRTRINPVLLVSIAAFAASLGIAIAQTEPPPQDSTAKPEASPAPTAEETKPVSSPLDGQIAISSWVLSDKVCALKQAQRLAIAAADGREDRNPPDSPCLKKCGKSEERYLVSDEFTSAGGEAWPSWKVDNPETLKDACGKHMRIDGAVVGRDDMISSLRFLRVSHVEPYAQVAKPALKPGPKNEQGQRLISSGFLPEARKYLDFLEKWDGGGTLDIQLEKKIKDGLSDAEQTDADESAAALLQAYRVTLSRRAAQEIFDGGKLSEDHAGRWATLLKTCREELDLSLTGGIALDKSKCVDSTAP